jgi:hypothetical protein
MAPKATKELIAARKARGVKNTPKVLKSKYAADVRDEGHSILARADSRPALQVWNEFKAFMKKNHISYVAHNVHPRAMLVSPDNRDGAMVNAHDVHSNLKTIREITADKDEVRNAWATEMPTDPDELEDVLADNDCIIKCSDGLLADRNGSERFLTFGCSHTGQGFKAVDSGCKTSEPDLADANGRLSADVFCKLPAAHGGGESAPMRELLGGWDLNVIPADAVEEWPECVSVGSKGLNISQTVPTQPSEVQTLLALADCVARGLDDADCMKRVLSSNPSCKNYIADVHKSAKLFADLPAALHRLTRFVGMHGGSKVVGSYVFKAIHTIKAFDRKEYAVMRLLVLYHALVSKRSLALSALAHAWGGEGAFPLFTAAAEAVTSATKYVDMLVHKGFLDDSQGIDVLGRFYVRVQLLITQAEGTTFEKTVFKTIGAIQKQLDVECSSIAQRKIPSPPWKAILASMTAAAAADATAQGALVATDAVMTGSGFDVGCNVFEKVLGADVTFKITAISDDVVNITKNLPHRFVAPAEFSVAAAEFLRNFQLTNQKIFCEYSGIDSAEWAKSLRGASVMHKLAELMLCNNKTDFIFTTDGVVRAARDFKSGDLVLFPSGMHYSFEASAGAQPNTVTCVSATQTDYICVHEPRALSESARAKAEFPPSFVLNPFWWVKQVKVDGNMKLVPNPTVPCEGMALTVDVFKNHRSVMKGEVLTRGSAKSGYLTVAKQVPKAAVKSATAKVAHKFTAKAAASGTAVPKAKRT